jgi:hypothetical protein
VRWTDAPTGESGQAAQGEPDPIAWASLGQKLVCQPSGCAIAAGSAIGVAPAAPQLNDLQLRGD